jgi:hypothetical protein
MNGIYMDDESYMNYQGTPRVKKYQAYPSS